MKTSRKLNLLFCLHLTVFLFLSSEILAQKRQLPAGGRLAVVVDERLSALRESPQPSGKLLKRLSRGRFVSIRGERRTSELVFYRVSITSRTSGWIQRDALIAPSRRGDDEKLFRLIQASDEFDRLVRARIFLDVFRYSRFRPAVLLLYGDTAEAAAVNLTREANRRLDPGEMDGGGAPRFSYFLNYNGLDRYNRQGVSFLFDRELTRFHYNGAAWREITRRYPRSAEAQEARKRLARQK